MIVFDFIGSVLSLIQIIVDFKWVVDFKINVPKMGLSTFTILFDLMFFLQEFCLYGRNGQRYTNKKTKLEIE